MPSITKTIEPIQLDLVPFLAKAMARHAAARRELDAIYAEGCLIGEDDASDKKKIYNRYYRQCDPLTEIYCHKATELLLATDGDGENRRRAAVAMEQLVKKCWRSIYAYIKHSGPVVPFDPFWLRQVKKEAKAMPRELRIYRLFPFSSIHCPRCRRFRRPPDKPGRSKHPGCRPSGKRICWTAISPYFCIWPICWGKPSLTAPSCFNWLLRPMPENGSACSGPVPRRSSPPRSRPWPLRCGSRLTKP
ncbi:hypothetical protein SPACI_012820 [Sporomusa acidovorans DSM 3132]|uniref:Uncharacterized protein n=1 Tax=Sporomusa acidovorans (strain ATCC 49682 / DSM 3132 / Mol) TaxID=1123286 RepID=A0ABZ3IYV8_SPOA4|nr:hypothetical protein SPACI_53350 [Sporomusa acidovorans DSM 3132]SDE69979.1 hypothetical protein SAMN04488499_101954 [Sporomusa acidovorans]